MEKGIYVKDILPNTDVDGIFVTVDPSLNQSKNGPFWKLGLTDATGVIEAKIWSPLSTQVGELTTGIFVLINGWAKIYNNSLQVNVNSCSPLPQESQTELDLANFIPASPYDRDEMFAALKMACMEEFVHAPWRKLVTSVLKDPEIQKAFSTSPAAKSMHHAYIGGLLEHTLGVFKLCRSLCDLYPELDRQTLLAGALFHDLGKIREFSSGLINDYTDEGRLIGHMSLGLELLQPFLAKSGLEEHLQQHLKHLILSHHGLHEYGAPCLPQTTEAFILHYADNIDAKMGQFRNLFAETDNPDPQWSPWQSSLSRKIYKPTPTPGQIQNTQKDKSGASIQCLSLWKE